jgi:hypothetical protein
MFGKSGKELAIDLLLTGGWALYASAFVKRLLLGGGLVELGQLTAVTIFAILFLVRRPSRHSGTTSETLLALTGTFLPAAVQPAPGSFYWLGDLIQIAGHLPRAELWDHSGRSRPPDRGSLRMGAAPPLRNGDRLLHRVPGRPPFVAQFCGPRRRHHRPTVPHPPRGTHLDRLSQLCRSCALAPSPPSVVITPERHHGVHRLPTRARRPPHKGDRATPTPIAASLAQGIIHGTNILRTRLRKQAFPSTDPKRSNREERLLECVPFEWFLRDVVISVESGRHRAMIRRALVERLRLDLERSGLSPEWLLQLERLHLSRFTEYSDAFEVASSLHYRPDYRPTSTSRRTRRRYHVDTTNVESIQAAPARQTSAYRSRPLDGAGPSPGSSLAMLSPRLAVIAQE